MLRCLRLTSVGLFAAVTLACSGDDTHNGSSAASGAGSGEGGADAIAAGAANDAGGPAEVCELGDEGCDCYPNGTCNGSLSCYSNLCVDASSQAQSGGDGGQAGSRTATSTGTAGVGGDSPGSAGTSNTSAGAPTSQAGSGTAGVALGSAGKSQAAGSANGGARSGGASNGGVGPGASNGGGGSGGTVQGGAGAESTASGGSAGASSLPVERHGALSVQGTQLVDASGERVQLRGLSGYWTNWQEWRPEQNATALRWLRDEWDVSAIRVAMAVGPEEGGYLEDPTANRRAVDAAIDAAVAAGVYVVVDWHDHAAHTHTADAETFFASIAETYGELPNVLYEIYNEPLDTASWASDVKPYHEQIVAAIRQSDADNVIILGSPSWSQDVDIAAAAPVAGDNLMYTLHFYACSHDEELRSKADEALGMGLPLFVTEWGATAAVVGDGQEEWVCEVEAQLWHDWMNANSISSLAWSLCDSDAEANCIVRPSTPESGGWDDRLAGHGPFVRDKLQGYEYDCANPRIVDTLEDGDHAICESGGRVGSWFVANDGTGTQIPSNNEVVPVALAAARGTSVSAAYSAGSQFSDWGALLGVILVEGNSQLEYFDASSFGGIRFHARGSGTLSAQLTTGRTVLAPNGYCAEDDCNQHFRFALALESDWVPFAIPFDWFESNAAGWMTEQDQRELLTIEFLATSEDFEIWVDDLGFY